MAQLQPQAAGLFDPSTRTIYLDRVSASSVLDCSAGTFDHTALHELVHAAQTVPTVLRTRQGRRGPLDRWLFEGATDVMAADVNHEASANTAALDLPEWHGAVYGPYEAVTHGLLACVSTPHNYRETLKEYVLLPYGGQLDWLRQRLLGSYEVRRRLALLRVLYGLMSQLPEEDFFERMQNNWRLTEQTEDIVARRFKRR